MARVDFYIIDTDNGNSICARLCDKAYQQGQRVYIHCDDEQHAKMLDHDLWQFREESFIPHQIIQSGTPNDSPILIGYGGKDNQDAPSGYDILMNQSRDVPAFYRQFSRVLEIVTHEEQAKTISRQHYQLYKNAGDALHNHRL